MPKGTARSSQPRLMVQAEVYTGEITGKIISITYTKDDFAAGVDFTITGEDTGINIWTQTNVDATATGCPEDADTFAGRRGKQHRRGRALSDIWLAQERIKIAIANGG